MSARPPAAPSAPATATTAAAIDPKPAPNVGFNAALQGPVTGLEPDFLRAVPIDNLVGALLALTSEVYVLRERLATLEAELESRRVLASGAVEKHAETPTERDARAADLAAFTRRVLSELARDRKPVSAIDPRVDKYLKPSR
jgi:hypothetical protein